MNKLLSRLFFWRKKEAPPIEVLLAETLNSKKEEIVNNIMHNHPFLQRMKRKKNYETK